MVKKVKILTLFLISIFYVSCSGKIEEGKSLLDKVDFQIISGDAQFAPTNKTFDQPIRVQISGASGLDGIPILFEILSGSVDGTLVSPIVNTDSNGYAQTYVKSGISNGTISVRASIAHAKGDPKQVFFNVVVDGNASSYEVTVVGGPVIAGTPFDLHVEAKLDDASTDPDFDGPRPLTITTDATSSPLGNSPTIPSTSSYNFTAGVIDSDISITLVDADPSVTMSVSGGSISGTSSAFSVGAAGTNDALIHDGATCSSNIVGDFTAIALNPVTLYSYYVDVYGNCVGPATADWTTTFTTPTQFTFDTSVTAQTSVTFTPQQPAFTGTVSIGNIVGGYTDSTGTITTADATPTDFGLIGLDSNGNWSVSSGDAAQVLVRAEDAVGNLSALYIGAHNLTWTTNSTATSPPTDTGLPVRNPNLPSNGSYNFTLGTLISPTPNVTLYRQSTTSTITVYDGANCGASICGTTPNITVTADAVNKAVVRNAAASGDGNGATFDATALTTTTDDSYSLYCATYDQWGNYLGDDAGADWGVTGAILAGHVTPSLVNQSTVNFNPTVTSPGSIYCDVDGTVDGSGIADSTGTFTILPGAPASWTIDGGSGEGSAFTETAGTLWSFDVKLYDADGNFAYNYVNSSHGTTVSYVTNSTALNPAAPGDLSPTYTSPKINNSNTSSFATTLDFSSGGTATVSNNLLINGTTDDGLTPQLQLVDTSGVGITTVTSGAISVNDNTLESISIMSAASFAGSYINNDAHTADETISMYAAGFDNSGNYLSDQSVDWTGGVSGNCVVGEISGNPIPTTSTVGINFDPTDIGSCTITADNGSGVTDTATVSLSHGAIAKFQVEVQGNPANVTAGTAFNVVVTALDADDNQVLTYTNPAGVTYTFTNTNGSSPEGQAPTGFTLSNSDFTNGQAIKNVTVYNAGTSFNVTVTETAGGSATGTTASTTAVIPNVLDHYETKTATGSFVADNSTTFGLTIEANDQWGNLTTNGIGNPISLSIQVTSDEAIAGTISSATGLSLGGASSQTFTGFTYGVSHGVKFIATDSGAVTTPDDGNRLTGTFTPHINGLISYTLDTVSDTTPQAGDVVTVVVHAKDNAGNDITGLETTLEGFTYLFASGSTDSPYSDSTVLPTNPLNFNGSGQATLSYQFFNDETFNISTLTIDNQVGETGAGGAGTINVDPNVHHHYANISSTTTPDSDAIDTFSADIRARDQYGNQVNVATTVGLSLNSLELNAGALGGTLAGITLTAGAATVSNLTYNAIGDFKLSISDGSISEIAARSVTYDPQIVEGSVQEYGISFSSPATAGSAFSVQVDAWDGAANTIPLGATLAPIISAREHYWVQGLNDSPEGDSPSPLEGVGNNAGLTFNNSGIATTTITFVRAETLAIAGLDIQDNRATPVTGTSVSSLTINPNSPHHIAFTGATTGVGDNETNYSVTGEVRDDWGNLCSTGTSNGADSALTLRPIRVSGATAVGPLAGTLTMDLQNNSSVTRNINYQVGHTIKFGFVGDPQSIPIEDANSVQPSFSLVKKTVADYVFEPLSTTVTTGTNFTVRMTARDGGGNTIDYGDAVLETISNTFNTNSACDAPRGNYLADTNGDPTNGTLDYTSGVVDLNYQVYLANAASCGLAGHFNVTDENARVGNNTTVLSTINTNVSEHFITTLSTGGAINATAALAAQTSTSVTVTLRDLYGNPRTDTISGNLLSLRKISGYSSVNGTLNGCSPVSGDGCAGAAQSITAINVDFSASSTQVIYDLAYDVADTIEIRAFDGGTIDTLAAEADNIAMTTVPATIDSYTFTRPSASAVAGATLSWQVIAKDNAGNTLTGAANKAMLDGLLYNITDQSAGSNQMDSPDASVAFADVSNQAITFNSGTGVGLIDVIAYNSTNDIQVGWLQFSDNTTAVTTTNDASNTMDITYANPSGGAGYFTVTTAGFGGAEVSNDTTYTGTSATITLYDDFGNLAQGLSSVQLVPRFVSGFTGGSNVGVLKATATDGTATSDVTGMTLDFSSVSAITLYDFSYNVFQTIDIRVFEGSTEASAANSADFDFDFHASNVSSYVMTTADTNIAAGTATSWTLTAYDNAGNVMSDATNQTELNSRNYTFSDNSAGNMNSPHAGNNVTLPNAGAATSLVWTTSGTAPFNVTAFNTTNNIATNYLNVSDDGTVVASGANAADSITIVNASGDHFHVTGSGFPSSATSAQDGATSVTIDFHDAYGNAATESTVTNAAVALNRVSGLATTGTFNVSRGDGDATPLDITGEALDFSSVSSITLHDIAYDVSHVLELVVTHGDAPGGTAGADTQDLGFNFTTSTIANYTLTFDNATATAGVSTAATLTAIDGGGNTVSDQDTALNSVAFNFSIPGGTGFDAPNASQTVAGNDPTNGSTFTWSSGTTSVSWSFFASGTVGTGFVGMTDGVNPTVTNSDTIVIDPNSAIEYFIQNPAESITGTASTVTVLARDTYGNTDTNFGTDVDIALTGDGLNTPTAVGGATITMTAGVGTKDVNDANPETISISLTGGAAITKLTEDVIFTGPPDTIVFLTEPVINQTIGNNFQTMPQVEVRDSAGTRVWADSSTLVTLTPWTTADCSTTSGSGVIASNTATVTAGRATFAGLNYSVAEDIYIRAGGTANPGCSASVLPVYKTLAILATPIATQQSGETLIITVEGGVPPVSVAGGWTNNSSGTLVAGTACAPNTCFDYTPGTTTAVTDTVLFQDSAGVTNSDSTTINVDGAILGNTGNSLTWTPTSFDVQHTFIINNTGNIASGLLTSTSGAATGDTTYFNVDLDNCNTDNLASGGGDTCDIQVTFLGATGGGGAPTNGTKTLNFGLTGATNGAFTFALSADLSGAIINQTAGSGTFGSSALDINSVFTFQNGGDATSGDLSLNLTGADASYFSLTTDGCDPVSLATTQTCNVTVNFLAETGNSGSVTNGAKSATLTVQGATGGLRTVALTGNRDGAILNEVNGTNPNFGSGSVQVTRTFRIQNDGNASSGALGVTFTGAGPEWQVDSDTCNTNTLNAAQNCDITISYRGDLAATGTYPATLTVDGATAGFQQVSITGATP